MATLLPRDADDIPIQALKPRGGGAHNVAVSTSSARNATAFDGATRAVALYATGAVYVRFGDSTVTAAATDHYFPGGTLHVFSLGSEKGAPATHIAALRVTADCVLYISELE